MPKIVKKENKIVKTVPTKRKTTATGEFILSGEQADLLEEACVLNKQKKLAEKRLKIIKAELDVLGIGEYTNKNKDLLKLTESEKYTDIDPEKLYKLFVKNRKKQKFWTVVKVQLAPLAKIIPESAIKSMRDELDPVRKFSFK